MRATVETGMAASNYTLLNFLVDFCYEKPNYHSALFFIEELTLLQELQKCMPITYLYYSFILRFLFSTNIDRFYLFISYF